MDMSELSFVAVRDIKDTFDIVDICTTTHGGRYCTVHTHTYQYIHYTLHSGHTVLAAGSVVDTPQ